MSRGPRSGAKNPRAKLTAADVRKIRRTALRKTLKYGWKSALARELGVSPALITLILNGERWGK